MVLATGLGGGGGSTLTGGASGAGCTGVTGKDSGVFFSAGFFLTTAAFSGGASAFALAAGGVTGTATGTGAGSSGGACEAAACGTGAGVGAGAISTPGAAAGVISAEADSVTLSVVANQ